MAQSFSLNMQDKDKGKGKLIKYMGIYFNLF